MASTSIPVKVRAPLPYPSCAVADCCSSRPRTLRFACLDAPANAPARLVCSGHTRPVPSLHFSSLESSLGAASAGGDPSFLLISSCKDGKPMLRDWYFVLPSR